MVSQRYSFIFLVVSCLINLVYLESAQADQISTLQTAATVRLLNNTVSTPAASAIAQNVTPAPNQIVVPQPPDSKLPEITIPDSILPQPVTPPTPAVEDPAVSRKILNALMLNALKNSAARYPWFVNPTNSVAASSVPFDPNQKQDYSTLDVRARGNQVIVRNFNYSSFRKDEQFYWVLPGNRVVVETQGWQFGIRYHGQTRQTRVERKIQQTQGLWGLQTAWTIPQPFKDLVGDIDPKTLTIRSISGEVVNPVGTPTGRVVLNTGVNDTNAIRIPTATLKLGTGSTFSGTGGSALFQFLDAKNTPLILQGFPTSNLQSLLQGEGLFVGAKIPKTALAQAGIVWGNPTMGTGTIAAPPISSLPGIKIGQLGKFDNLDLLNVLVNSSLSQPERDFHYLNSLYWVSLGERAPKIVQESISVENNDWHQISLSLPHSRSLLQYDSTEAKATYSNVFSNPGAAISFSFEKGKLNDLQTFNATFALLMGGLFKFVELPALDQSLQEAGARFKKQEQFANLETKATSEQRRQINQRLNRSLFFANRLSGLQETSGSVTFPSTVTPDRASVFQIRSGMTQRLVRFIQAEQTWTEGDTVFSRLRLSNENFGPLTFLGTPIPATETSLEPSNRSFATQVVLDAPDGQRFFQEFNSQDLTTSDFTTVPTAIRSFDMAFDLIELKQTGRQITRINRFDGYLFLPTVEALWSGSHGKWNYTVNSGLWLNFNGNAAFEVSTNNRGTPEPTVGMYLNGLVNHIDTRVRRGKDGKPRSLITMSPALRFSWNTAANPSNPGYINLSYLYSEQSPRFSYSLTPGVFVTNDNARVQSIAFLQGQFELPRGFAFNSSLEWGENFYYSIEASQKVDPFWTVGSYVQNYRSDSSWVGRLSDMSYGILIRHQPLSRAASWETKLGMSGNQFEVRVEGSFQF
jgi:hypothetical protein